MRNYPSVSIVIPTFNSEKTITLCLKSVEGQTYPKSKREIIVVDGSSDDTTRRIVKKYDTRLIVIPSTKQNAEYNKSIGFGKSKGDLVLILDSDNILPHKKWLQAMVRPMTEHQDVVGVDTLYIHYDKRYSLIDRYLGLFGSLDPVAFYLQKADKLSRIGGKEYLLQNASDKGKYYLVSFNPMRIPSIGSNGFLMRRSVFVKYAKTDPKHFFHADIHVDVIKKGFNRYAFIKDDIIHMTGMRNFFHFLKRRMQFMKYNYTHQNFRRHSIYESQDLYRLIWYIVISLTFIKPTFDSIRGYMKIRDNAWFLHPILCFIFVIIYGYVVLTVAFNRIFKRSI